MHRGSLAVILLTLGLSLTACSGSGSTPDTGQATGEEGSTSKIAGFWDFTTQDEPGIVDEQYVHLTDDGQWFVYARFMSNPNADLNCYESAEVSIRPLDGDTYEVVSTSGYKHEIDLSIVNGELQYIYSVLGNGSNLQTEYFPPVVGFTAQDLQVCES